MSEQEVFDYIYSVITREYLENRIQKKENFGITAKDIADHFNTYRSTVSTMLNTAVKNGLFIKIETRPVLFVPVDIIKKELHVHLEKSVYTPEEIRDLFFKKEQEADSFSIMIGYDGSQSLQIKHPVAYTIAMILPKKWQQAGIILVMIPFWINFLIRSYSWVIILRAQGLVNTFLLHFGFIEKPLGLLYNNTAVLLGMVYGLLPFMVLPIYVSLEQMDKRLLEAASDLGASPFTAFRKITLPLTLPGVAAGSILVFISSLGMFVVPDIMGGAKSSLMGNVIQNQFLAARDWPFGSALSIILALLSLVMIILYYKALEAQKGGKQHEEKLA